MQHEKLFSTFDANENRKREREKKIYMKRQFIFLRENFSFQKCRNQRKKKEKLGI